MATLDTDPATWVLPLDLFKASLSLRDYLPIRHMAVSGLDRAMSVNASAILAYEQRHQIQVVATVTSTVSITASLLAIYWFCLMRRNFRRDLVLLLIMGDFWKSFVYLLYATATFARGQLQTTSGFCQVGGYMLTAGIEACGKLARH